jgi:hypothetical protein
MSISIVVPPISLSYAIVKKLALQNTTGKKNAKQKGRDYTALSPPYLLSREA